MTLQHLKTELPGPKARASDLVMLISAAFDAA